MSISTDAGSASARPLRLALVGYGAIGGELLRLLRSEPGIEVRAVVVRPERVAEAQASRIPAVARVPLQDVDLVLEAGGHSAIAQHVVPALQAGISCVIASAGALASQPLLDEVRAAATRSGAQAQVIPGAIGGIDALAAARLYGLDEVLYTGSKPPAAWRGTPAERRVALDGLEQPAVIFEGSAREAAMLYPKNANVTATVSLAGVGFDATRVRLVADPGVKQNVHRLQARGNFGSLDLTVSCQALPANPKTSALTVYSALRALVNRVQALSI
jgi:aspartate dehydrogenase